MHRATGKTIVKWIGLLVLAAVAVFFTLFQISKSTGWQLFGTIVPRVTTDRKLVALTFDDGPEPGATEKLLQLLGDRQVKATFFLVGRSMEKHPEQAAMIARAGHQLGNHSYTHSRMVMLDYETVAEELENTERLIRDAGYSGEIYFRPPYGKKLFNLPRYLNDRDITSVTWDIAPETFAGPMTPEEISGPILERVRPGSIILLHPMHGYRDTVLQALPEVIDSLKARGYHFATLSELLAAETAAD